MRVRTDSVKAYAHCPDPVCEGFAQEEVDATQVEKELTLKDLGGDSTQVERSWLTLEWADPDDTECPHCKKQTRELTPTLRPIYQPLSGHDPRGLLAIKAR